MINKNDLRVIKTRNALFETLITLMKDKPFEEIKVSEICKISLINRSTFYSHYQDKYELFLDFIDYLKCSLSDAISKNNEIINTKEYYIELIKILLSHIEEKKDIYYAVLINNKNSIVTDMLYNVILEDVNKRIEKESGKKLNKIISAFYIGAVISLGIEWLKNKTILDEDIIKYLNILIPDNIEDF